MGFSRPQEKRQQPSKRQHHPLKPQSNPLRATLSKTTQSNMASILKLLPHSHQSNNRNPPSPRQQQHPISATGTIHPHVSTWLSTQLPPLSPSKNPVPPLIISSPSPCQTPLLTTLQSAITSSREAETLHAYDVGVIAALQSMLLYWNSRASAMQTSVAERRIFLREAQRLTELMDDAEREMLISNADLVAKQGVEEQLWGGVSIMGRGEGEMDEDWDVGMGGSLGGDGEGEGEFGSSSCGRDSEEGGDEVDMDGDGEGDGMDKDENQDEEMDGFEDVGGIRIESEGSECSWLY